MRAPRQPLGQHCQLALAAANLERADKQKNLHDTAAVAAALANAGPRSPLFFNRLSTRYQVPIAIPLALPFAEREPPRRYSRPENNIRRNNVHVDRTCAPFHS